MADSADDLRRAKGRRGLDVLESLRREHGVELLTVPDEAMGVTDVDAKLVRMSIDRNCALLTFDTNLAKAAAIAGVKVLNLHGLALALRPLVVVGDEVDLHLLKAGKEAGQAVGYLDDGTMVVTEHARDRVGQECPRRSSPACSPPPTAASCSPSPTCRRGGRSVSRTAAVVPAAGAVSGSAPVPRRRCALLGGVPMLVHAVRALASAHGRSTSSWSPRPRTASTRSRALLAEHGLLDAAAGRAGAVVVAGGDTRQDSVARALVALPAEVDVVLVHDAARPLVPPSLVDAVAAAVRGGADAVVPGLPVADTVKSVDAAGRSWPPPSTARLAARDPDPAGLPPCDCSPRRTRRPTPTRRRPTTPAWSRRSVARCSSCPATRRRSR